MNKYNLNKSNIFKLSLSAILLVLCLLSFLKPDNRYLTLGVQLLLVVMISNYALESFKSKKWWAFSAYTLIVLFSLFVAIQTAYLVFT